MVTPKRARVSLAAIHICVVLAAVPALAQTPPATTGSVPPDAGEAKQEGAHHDTSIGTLARDLARDFRRLPSKETGIWLGAGLGTTVAAHEEDRHVTLELAGAEHLTRALDPGTALGSGWMQGGSAIAAYAVGRFAGKPAVAHLGADLIRAQAVTGAMTAGLKFAVGRTRPNGGRLSFPSGHTSATVASATVLAEHFGWKAAVPAYAVAGYVATSRVQRNHHFLSDVVFGTAVGLAGARTITVGHGSKQHALVVAPLPGGLAVSLTRVEPR